MHKHKFSILNTARWETETITEWLLYYASIGFDHVYMYCNDDDPSELYEKLLPFITLPEPFVTFHHLPYQGQQDYCWTHFLSNHKDETEWFMFLDADEFLALKGCDNIRTFMHDRELKYDCIYFNWIWFGPQHFAERPGGSTLLQFTLREDHRVNMNHFVKTLTRSSCVDAGLISYPPQPMLNHNWPNGIAAKMRRANVLGHSMDEYFSTFPASADSYLASEDVRTALVDTACLYHFLFRSRRDFLRRYERGTLGAYYFQPMWKNLYESAELDNFIGRLNAVEDTYLADYWRNFLAKSQDTTLVSRSPFANLALSSTPTQSSTCQWSNNPDPDLDARGAISGKHTGADGFHTDEEQSPWWRTDLGQNCQLHEIRLFNSLKAAITMTRAYNFEICCSLDGESWNVLFSASPPVQFGGADGHPFILKLFEPVVARFVRVGLTTRAFFHLDQIEIYGLRAEQFQQA